MGSDLSENNRCPDCRIVLLYNGKCSRCKAQVKPRPVGIGYPPSKRGILPLHEINGNKPHGEAFFKAFDNEFNLPPQKISRCALEWWEDWASRMRSETRTPGGDR